MIRCERGCGVDEHEHALGDRLLAQRIEQRRHGGALRRPRRPRAGRARAARTACRARKKFSSATSARSCGYTLPARSRSCSASGVRSTSTTSSASRATRSGKVSRTRMSRELGDRIVQALEMLDVDGGDDVDAGGEHLVDVLVALLVPQARRVGVRELVDQGQLRRTADHGVDVHLLEVERPCSAPQRRHDLEPLGERGGLGPVVRLEVADHDVAALAPAPAGLPGACGRSCRRRLPSRAGSGIRHAPLPRAPVGLGSECRRRRRSSGAHDRSRWASSRRTVVTLARAPPCPPAGPSGHAPKTLWMSRSISLMPMNGRIMPPTP